MKLQEGGRELEQKVLEALKEKIAEYGDESEIRHVTTSFGEVDILTAYFTRFGEHLDHVMGEFMFQDKPGDPYGCRYFTAVLTLKEEIPLDNAPELTYALSILNFYIDAGCFAVNKPVDHLVYKNARLFSGDTEEAALMQECILEFEDSVETTLKYNTVVQALAEGSLGLEQFLSFIIA
ncbi:MAG: hypothetical protein K6G34_00010 [Lachnospiraceae bacterium]|nr:hypothetical protein [Lachnospiraceae bacterium]